MDGLLLREARVGHVVVEARVVRLFEERFVGGDGLLLFAEAELRTLVHLSPLDGQLGQLDRLVVLTEHCELRRLTVAMLGCSDLSVTTFILARVQVRQGLLDLGAHVYQRSILAATRRLRRHVLYHFSYWLHFELGAW